MPPPAVAKTIKEHTVRISVGKSILGELKIMGTNDLKYREHEDYIRGVVELSVAIFSINLPLAGKRPMLLTSPDV